MKIHTRRALLAAFERAHSEHARDQRRRMITDVLSMELRGELVDDADDVIAGWDDLAAEQRERARAQVLALLDLFESAPTVVH